MPTSSLNKGAVQSCGCWHRQRASEANIRHGSTGSPEYKVWATMKTRCSNPAAWSFKDYGARGVRVCDAWAESFEQFLADMGPRPGPGFTIERDDVNGNYEPGNCRWATRTEQANNTRANRVLEAFGRRATLTQWAREIGVKVGTLAARLDRYGMSVEEALSFRR